MIALENVSKVYNTRKDKVLANDNISLKLEKGQILGLFGHNGAGKTTLVNQIIGILKPTSGEIIVSGVPIAKKPDIGRFICSVQPQSQLSFGELTPLDAVITMGMMRGGKKEEVKKEAMRLFESLDILDWINKEGNQLSGGVKRLTAFCMAVVNSNKVIILDEPTNDVDPVRRKYLWQEIKKLTETGRSVILVTHNITEAESIVDKVVILHKGKKVADGSISEIVGNEINKFKIELSQTSTFNKNCLPEFPHEILDNKPRIKMVFDKEYLNNCIDWANNQVVGKTIYDYSFSQSSLEDIYIKLTDGEGGTI